MELIAKPIGEDVQKLRVTHLSAVARAIRLTCWHRTDLDGSSDEFGELLLDMFEWNLGPSFVMKLE